MHLMSTKLNKHLPPTNISNEFDPNNKTEEVFVWVLITLKHIYLLKYTHESQLSLKMCPRLNYNALQSHIS